MFNFPVLAAIQHAPYRSPQLILVRMRSYTLYSLNRTLSADLKTKRTVLQKVHVPGSFIHWLYFLF